MTQAKLTDAERERVREREQVRKLYTGSGYDGLINEYADAPRWKDEEAQLEYLREKILRSWTLEFPFRTKEERAVEKSLRGKQEQLAAWIEDPNNQLAPRTRALMAEYLREKRNLRTGKAKGEPGAPKTGERKRRANSPVHLATEIYLLLRGTLPMIYPYQSEAHIDERAMSLAAKLKGVEPESIYIHFKK